MDQIHEVTEWKQAEEALRNSLATCERAVKGLADQKFALDQHAGVVVTDVLGIITYVNDKFCAVSQYSRDELVGKNHRILNSGLHTKEFFRQMYYTIANGKVWQGEIKSRAKDGSIYWGNTTIVPFVDAEETPWQYLAIRADITESKLAAEALAQSEDRRAQTAEELRRSNQDLQRSNEDLRRSNEDLRQIAYVASHDLQEPLRMVVSYTQLLAQHYKGRLDPDADEFIALAVGGCNRMQALIRDLLTYSRVGANGESGHEASTENALQESLENLRTAIEESGAVVTHDSLPSITTNHAQLVQVFQNLVGNAIKHRSAKIPLIHVSAEKNRSQEWVFFVRDNGIGIAPQYFERIFVLFQRLHCREELEGNGIGLAICKKIVEQQGGRIWVESELGEGSIFYFTLPSSALPQTM